MKVPVDIFTRTCRRSKSSYKLTVTFFFCCILAYLLVYVLKTPFFHQADMSLSGFRVDGKILMDDYNFVGWLNEIYEHLDLYEGIRIETSGFVFRSEEFLPDQFVPARMMMICCAADAQPVGFLCSYGQAAHLPDGAWVKVTGVITRITYGEDVIPLLRAEKVVPAEKPETEYVYPME